MSKQAKTIHTRPTDRPVCPVCGKMREDESHAPFCSKRCRQVDLGRWLDEAYVISRPVEQRDLDEGQ